MNRLLDTDHISLLQRQASSQGQALRARIGAAVGDRFFTCTVGFNEQMLGVNAFMAKGRESNLVIGSEMLLDVLQTYRKFVMLPYDQRASAIFLGFPAVRIGKRDLRIATIALANDMTLLTRNARDFSKIPGLKFEDWTV